MIENACINTQKSIQEKNYIFARDQKHNEQGTRHFNHH